MGMLRTGVIVVACATAFRRLQTFSIGWSKRKANQGRSVSSPDETGAHAFVLTNPKGVQLYCRRWGSIDKPTAAFVFVHSELLTGSAFKNLAEKLTQKGYVCYSVDLTGFGKSGYQQGVQSHIEHYSDYIDDLSAIVDCAKLETDNAPVILYGEGLGGTCCLAFDLIEENKGKVMSIIATSPRLKPSIDIDTVESGLYGLLGKLFPTLPGPREQPTHEITELFGDAEVGMEAQNNFDNLQPASVKKIKEIEAMCEYVDDNVDRLSVPLMVLHGQADARNATVHSENLKVKAGSARKYIRVYPDVRHGILHGPTASLERIVTDIVAFIQKNMPASSRDS